MIGTSFSTLASENDNVYPVTNTINYENGINKSEIDDMISEVNIEKLCKDTVEKGEVINKKTNFEKDVFVTAYLEPNDGEDEINIEVKQTKNKIGEITKQNGQKADLYVTVAVASNDVTIDKGYNKKYEVEAYLFIYWIDNLGVDNELYRVAASWNDHGQSVNNRTVTYGISDATGFLINPATTKAISGTEFNQIVHGEYMGFILGAKSSINVVNKGTLNCYARTSF